MVRASADGKEAAVTGHELSAEHSSMAREVDAAVTQPQTRKFVRVEVVAVVNPQKVPISFLVHYRAPQGAPMPLGMFSLFPPDRPGTFIVATQGRLRQGGTVTVQLVPATEKADLQGVRVRLGAVSFTRE